MIVTVCHPYSYCGAPTPYTHSWKNGVRSCPETDEHTAAEASFRDAIALAQRQGARLFELRASTSLARLWRDQGRRKEARALLAPIYGWFTEGFDAPDLKEAKALLDELA